MVIFSPSQHSMPTEESPDYTHVACTCSLTNALTLQPGLGSRNGSGRLGKARACQTLLLLAPRMTFGDYHLDLIRHH